MNDRAPDMDCVLRNQCFCLFWCHKSIGNQIIQIVSVDTLLPQSRIIHFFHFLNGLNKSTIAF